jgi:hypothetical protein
MLARHCRAWLVVVEFSDPPRRLPFPPSRRVGRSRLSESRYPLRNFEDNSQQDSATAVPRLNRVNVIKIKAGGGAHRPNIDHSSGTSRRRLISQCR